MHVLHRKLDCACLSWERQHFNGGLMKIKCLIFCRDMKFNRRSGVSPAFGGSFKTSVNHCLIVPLTVFCSFKENSPSSSPTAIASLGPSYVTNSDKHWPSSDQLFFLQSTSEQLWFPSGMRVWLQRANSEGRVDGALILSDGTCLKKRSICLTVQPSSVYASTLSF